MSNWKEYKISEVCNTQTGPFGSQLHNEDYVEKGTPIVTVEHLGSKNFTTQNLPCVSIEDKIRLSKYILNEGDVVLSRVGSVDRSSYVSVLNDGWLFSGRCLRLRPYDKTKVDSQFLYYHINNEKIKNYIRNIAVGATMPSINTKLLNEVPISLPPLEEQKKISGILSSLDDKIETNRRINARLEELAQALFKSWFIDYEPFGGKMPADWEECSLSELLTVKYGKDHKKLASGRIPVYGSGGIMRYVEKWLYDKESVLVPRKGTLHNIIYTDEPFWSVDTMFYTEMKKENLALYIYYCLKRLNWEAMNSGSAIPSMTTKILNALKIILPPNTILISFEEVVKPIFMKIKKLNTESARLAELRDALLPKLMSGELSEVSEVSEYSDNLENFEVSECSEVSELSANQNNFDTNS